MTIENCWPDPAAVFRRLAGSWRFHRTISPDMTMDGEAAFLPAASGDLSYHEQGRLVLGTGQSLEAERRYLFRPAPAGFAVFFAEPPFALFHQIALETGESGHFGTATHSCGDDTYVSTYLFRPDGGFSLRHAVKGPRKDYVSLTEFHRAGATTAP